MSRELKNTYAQEIMCLRLCNSKKKKKGGQTGSPTDLSVFSTLIWKLRGGVGGRGDGVLLSRNSRVLWEGVERSWTLQPLTAGPQQTSAPHKKDFQSELGLHLFYHVFWGNFPFLSNLFTNLHNKTNSPPSPNKEVLPFIPLCTHELQSEAKQINSQLHLLLNCWFL